MTFGPTTPPPREKVGLEMNWKEIFWKGILLDIALAAFAVGLLVFFLVAMYKLFTPPAECYTPASWSFAIPRPMWCSMWEYAIVVSSFFCTTFVVEFLRVIIRRRLMRNEERQINS